MSKEDDFLTGTLKIAFGIALGGLLLWAAAEYRTRYLVHQFNLSVQRELDMVRENQLMRVQAQQEQRRIAQENQRSRLQLEEQRRRVILEREKAKARAWADFYQPSQQCLETASVECGNAHIRARREFDRLYDSGQFTGKPR